MSNPKVFISYAWSTEDHQAWVKELVDRLLSDGIDVQFDKYDLRDGHDATVFMESMVTSPDVSKVLLVSDKVYAEKADSRKGGVGTETQIISKDVYDNTKQEKFIPLLCERDEDGEPYLPTFLKSRVYIDFSKDDNFETSYDRLIRNLHGKPELKKPPLGKIPSYLESDSISLFSTRHTIPLLRAQIDKYPKRINTTIRKFLDQVYKILDSTTLDLTLLTDDKAKGMSIASTVDSLRPLKDDFIDFLHVLLSSHEEFDVSYLIDFFSQLGDLQRYRPNEKSSTVEHFQIITYELFIFTLALSIKTERHSIVEELLYSEYTFDTGREQRPKAHKTYEEAFYYYLNTHNSLYAQTLARNQVNEGAQFLIDRLPIKLSLEDVVTADYLCYYIAVSNKVPWFPQLYHLKDEYTKLTFFSRLVSRRYCKKVSNIYGVDTIEELREKVINISKSAQQLNGYGDLVFRQIVPLSRFVEPSTVGSVR